MVSLRHLAGLEQCLLLGDAFHRRRNVARETLEHVLGPGQFRQLVFHALLGHEEVVVEVLHRLRQFPAAGHAHCLRHQKRLGEQVAVE